MSRKRKTDTVFAKTLDDALALIPSLPESEYQWAAGFIEADGCINIGASKERREGRRDSTYRYHVVLVVVQKDRRPLYILQKMFGGKIKPVYRRNKTQRYNQWTLCANRAYAALVLLEPFIRVKKEQVNLAMTLQRSINAARKAFNRWNKLSAEENFQRQQIYTRCKFLNSKEYISSFSTASGEFGGTLSDETIPSQATPDIGSVEGVTARAVTSKNNPLQECPTRSQRDDIA